MKTVKTILLEINTAKALEHHSKVTKMSMSQIVNIALDHYLSDNQ
jgi:hypothetical protein